MIIKNEIDKTNLQEIYKLSIEQFGKESWTFEQFESSLNNPLSIFYIAEKENRIVGFLLANDLIDSINLLLIATKEEFKRSGIAKKLIENLYIYKKPVWLEVRETNVVAQKFYKSCGFNFKHVRNKYYKNGENAFIYEKI